MTTEGVVALDQRILDHLVELIRISGHPLTTNQLTERYIELLRESMLGQGAEGGQ
ncbi:MAG: hypothetical protein KKA73_16860 [Chloroflexi bacterium]|nr:hypothetical protein [Chloroflexota bacterium]MBU1749358.1 hypothetical protein [Chloroflexota bacterium]MBU1877439.1 hypothetical protein [Chloroflexota bacterium]